MKHKFEVPEIIFTFVISLLPMVVIVGFIEILLFLTTLWTGVQAFYDYRTQITIAVISIFVWILVSVITYLQDK